MAVCEPTSVELNPPSRRDFEIYHKVVIDGSTTRAVATYHQLSQTRVCQLVRRVRQFLRRFLAAADGASSAELVAEARFVAAERLDGMYILAMNAWHSSSCGSTRAVTHEAEPRRSVNTYTSSEGNPRYLTAAKQIVSAIVRLGLPAGQLTEAEAQAADEAPLESDVPPVGDCSLEAEIADPEVTASAAETATNPDEAAVCDDSAKREAAPEPANINTVHRPLLGLGGAAQLQICLTPDQPGVTLDELVEQAARVPAERLDEPMPTRSVSEGRQRDCENVPR